MPIVFSSSAAANILEGSTGVVRNVEASLNGGAIDDGITYSITGGADQALFTIDTNTGELSFIAAPDYEAAADAGLNNIYNVTVTATGAGPTAESQDLTITVTDDAVEASLASRAMFTSIELADLNGVNGFTLRGVSEGDLSGIAASNLGDINGDGFDDVIIGAPNADPSGNSNAGESYVVFGRADGFDAAIELSDLDGSNGFVVNGTDLSDLSGLVVSGGGDLNGDGLDDIIISALYADPNGNNDAGETYIIYGKRFGYSPSLELSSLNGNNGFVINGVAAADRSGGRAFGDINGDGFLDIVLSASRADPNGNDDAGSGYVVYGTASGFGASFDLAGLDGVNGFTINGIDSGDNLSASIAGDINGDGFEDLFLTANRADVGGLNSAGESYILFGKAEGFGATVELTSLNGANGFKINGVSNNGRSGFSGATGGDINGDGYDDIIIGAHNVGGSGTSYVIFGKDSGFSASMDFNSLDGNNGFAIRGIDNGDQSSRSIAIAGDINGDGFDDILVSARYAEPHGFRTGESYIIFGKAGGFSSTFELSDLNGAANLNGALGIVINGINAEDTAGDVISSAGDVNGDGFADILIGGIRANPNGNDSGQSYIVFGGPLLIDAPTLINAPSDVTLVEDVASAVDISSVIFGDEDNDPVTATLSVDSGTFSAPVDGSGVGAGITATLVNSTTITLAGLVADINAYLDTPSNIRYTGALNAAGNNVATLTVTPDDGAETGITSIINIDISSINDAAVIFGDNSVAVNKNTVGAKCGDLESSDVDNPNDVFVAESISGVYGELTVRRDGIWSYNVDNENSTVQAMIDGDSLTETFQIRSIDGTPKTVTVTIRGESDPVTTQTDGNDNLHFCMVEEAIILLNGDDTVETGVGNDTIVSIAGEDGDDIINSQAGDDIVSSGGGDDTLIGGAGADTLIGESGDDVIFTNQMPDNEDGDLGRSSAWGGSGNDSLTSGFGSDVLGGGIGDDYIVGGRGEDTLYGGRDSGQDSVNGSAGNDEIFGGGGNDVVNGGSGSDTLWAGAGDDALTGGSGADTFVFGVTSGSDTVTDFDTGEDTIDVRYALADFADLDAVRAASTESAAGVTINLGDSGSVLIEGITIADLTGANVVF